MDIEANECCLFINMLDNDIYEHIHEEVSDGVLSLEEEQALHVLFENRKHAAKFLAMKEAEGGEGYTREVAAAYTAAVR